jgi:hypothetical protein
VTNRDSIYARLTDDIVDIVDNVKTAHLRPSAPTTFRRDNVNIVNNVRCQSHRYRPSHRPSRPSNVNALIWLALQIGNEPSTTDDYLLSSGESERRRWAGRRRTYLVFMTRRSSVGRATTA